MTRNCCYCRFYSEEIIEGAIRHKSRHVGDCRRHAPNGTIKPFPLVGDLDWCGEWAPGKENHPPTEAGT